MTRTFERRAFDLSGIQIRAADDEAGKLHFTGRAIVYGSTSVDFGGWSEIINPGAASRTLAANPDVRFLMNHDANRLLARTVSSTLGLTEDADGVMVDAQMANVSYARDLAELLDRGDLTQMSFGFWVVRDEWSANLHIVHEFDLDGGDVSAVTFPAYTQTSAGLRSNSLVSPELRAIAQTHLALPNDDYAQRARRRQQLVDFQSQL